MSPSRNQPDYLIDESRYHARRKHAEYAGWFTELDYEQNFAQIMADLAKGLALAPGRLLDLGCRAGNLSWRLAKQGYTVTGVDISPTGIQWARENAAKAGFSVAFRQHTWLR